jgi:phosphotransferase system HPr-like phosphotransfer protein
MIKKYIIFYRHEDVEDFVKAISKYDVTADIALGSSVIVDAKSIMGVTSLQLGKRLKLILHTEDTKFADEIFESINKYIWKEDEPWQS